MPTAVVPVASVIRNTNTLLGQDGIVGLKSGRLARELAAETGETLTEAVMLALRERLDRQHARHDASMRMRLARLAADVATLPVADGKTPEDIIGYDDAGVPS